MSLSATKLQPQTVYVPVQKHTGLYMKKNGVSGSVQYMQKLPGVYVLTGKELADLLTEYEESLHGNSTSFLKEKGVEI